MIKNTRCAKRRSCLASVSRIAAAAAVAGSILPLAPLAQAETLNEALAMAYQSSPTLRAARAALRSVDEKVPEALAGYRPQADFSAGGGYSSGTNSSNSLSSKSSGPVAAFDLRVRQPIYKFGTGAAVDQAKDEVKSQRARLQGVEADVLLRAVTAYVDVVRTEAVLNYSIAHQQALERDVASSKRQFERGEVRRSGVAEAEARLAVATAQRTQAESNLAVARATYQQIVGQSPDSLTMPPVPAGLPESREEAIARAQDAASVSAAEYAEKAARNGIDVTSGLKLPQTYLQGDAGPQSQSILALVSVPLYNGVLDPQIRAAKSLAEQRRLEYDAERLSAQQSAVSAWESLQAANSNQASFAAQVKAAQIAVDGARHEQELGLRSVQQVLLDQLDLLNGQVSEIGAERDARVAAYQLLAAIGHLTAADLGLDTPLHDPKAHYDAVHNRWFGTDPAPQ